MTIDLKINAMRVKGPGCVVPFMACTGIRCSTGYRFCPRCTETGYIFSRVCPEMVYNFVLVCPNYKQGIACTVDMICSMNSGHTPSIKSSCCILLRSPMNGFETTKSAFCPLS